MNPELAQYIKKRLEEGATSEIIVSEMVPHGWPKVLVEEAVKRLTAPAVPTPPVFTAPANEFQSFNPSPSPSFIPQETFAQPISTTTAQVSTQAHMGYAGFWVRAVATLLDSFILTIPMALIALGLQITFQSEWVEIVNSLISIVLGAGYFIILESSVKQSTWGKRLCGLAVTTTDGSTITASQAFVRHFSKILSFFTLLIGFIMVAFTEKKQALHDKIAHTVVVKRKNAPVGKIVLIIIGLILALGLLGVYVTKKVFDSIFSSFEMTSVIQEENTNDQSFFEEQTQPETQNTQSSNAAPATQSDSSLVSVAKYYGGPYTSAGPALIIFDPSWIEVVAPASLAVSPEQESILNFTSIIAKDGKNIYDAASNFEKEFFRQIDFKLRTEPRDHYHDYRLPNLIEGYTTADIVRIEGTLILNLTSGQSSHPFTLNVQ